MLSHVRLFVTLLMGQSGSFVPGILQAKIEWVAIPFSWRSSHTRSPALQADCLPFEPAEKGKCEDIQTKNSHWARKHNNLDYKLATWQNHQSPSFLKDTDKVLTHIPKLVSLEVDSSS